MINIFKYRSKQIFQFLKFFKVVNKRKENVFIIAILRMSKIDLPCKILRKMKISCQ